MWKIECILFDMDGVLIDAKERHADAFLQACKDEWVILTKEFHETHLEALPTRKKIDILIEKWLVTLERSEEIYRLKQYYTDKLLTEKNLYDKQKVDLLSTLKNEGCLLWVCSNSIRTSVEYITQKMGIYEYFDCVLSNNDVTHPKPNPEMYLKAMEMVHVRPEETLIIEDSIAGVAAGEASGARVLRVENATQVTFKNIYATLI